MKKICSVLLIAFFAAIFLNACGNNSGKKEDAVKQPDSVTNVSSQPISAEKEIKLICREMGVDSSDNPQHDVLLSVDGVQTKIKTIYACAEISKESYEQYEIPKEAVMACGGWWAGAGDYYYVIMKDGKPVVFEGWNEEGQEDKGYHWKEVTVK